MRSVERAEAKIARLHAQADEYSKESGRLRVLADGQLERAAECRQQANALRRELISAEARKVVHVE